MDDEPDLASFCVIRRHGCVGIKGGSPYSGDVQALLKEWDYKKYRVMSIRLARKWGCLVVLCPDYDAEAEALAASDGDDDETADGTGA